MAQHSAVPEGVEVVEPSGVSEAKINPVNEQLYCNGDTVALHGEYDNPDSAVSAEEVRVMVDAIKAGAETVTTENGAMQHRGHGHVWFYHSDNTVRRDVAHRGTKVGRIDDLLRTFDV